ncbi:protein of unknown function [Pseudomonas mediterranea]
MPFLRLAKENLLYIESTSRERNAERLEAALRQDHALAARGDASISRHSGDKATGNICRH